MQSDSEEEQAQAAKQAVKDAKRPDLTKVFDLKKPEEVKYEECIKKLTSDDIQLMRKLIAKYGDDIKSMFKDIKLNFMQYSKGQLRNKHKAYVHFGYGNKTQK